MGWKVETFCLFMGESVAKGGACGGGSDRFNLLPSRAFGGELVGWRTDLRGDRPLGLEAGGLRMMPPLRGDSNNVSSSVKMLPMKS